MQISGQTRATLIAALWIALVVALFLGVSTGAIALLWNFTLIVTSVLTGLWAAEWYKWRAAGGRRR